MPGEPSSHASVLHAWPLTLSARPSRRPRRIASDSRYAVSSLNEWARHWATNGWRTSTRQPVKNKEMIQEIIAAREARWPGDVPPEPGKAGPLLSRMLFACGLGEDDLFAAADAERDAWLAEVAAWPYCGKADTFRLLAYVRLLFAVDIAAADAISAAYLRPAGMIAAQLLAEGADGIRASRSA